jgi:hypothetical protein
MMYGIMWVVRTNLNKNFLSLFQCLFSCLGCRYLLRVSQVPATRVQRHWNLDVSYKKNLAV